MYLPREFFQPEEIPKIMHAAELKFAQIFEDLEYKKKSGKVVQKSLRKYFYGYHPLTTISYHI